MMASPDPFFKAQFQQNSSELLKIDIGLASEEPCSNFDNKSSDFPMILELYSVEVTYVLYGSTKKGSYHSCP